MLVVLSISAFAADKEFGKPVPVHIKGLPNGFGGTPISTEEPFLSRDGRFLFFNSGRYENNKDLYYAEWINEEWLYRGSLGPGVNSVKDVQGNPTMDSSMNFFYIESSTSSMVRFAVFQPGKGTLKSIKDLKGIPKRKIQLLKQLLTGNMGVEVSDDGKYLYFSRATWRFRYFKVGIILASNILFATKINGKYVYNEAEAKRIMTNINTMDFEYAASISKDGLELFFTRLACDFIKKGLPCSKIMRATRKDITSPFGLPKLIQSIGYSDFVEGPAISSNGKELYYHKKVGNKFRIFKVSR